MEMLVGTKLTKETRVGSETIHWKQGSFVGFGGDRSQTYDVFKYKAPNGGLVPVYVQSGYDSPAEMVADSKLQYGMNNGVFFLVLHDKSQTPYQHRFIQNDIQKMFSAANSWVKKTGYDLSWIAGDYLRNF